MKIKVIPILMNIISKIDLKPVLDKLKDLDIFKEGQDYIEGEQALILGSEIICALSPQLGKISDQVIPFIALYKGIDEEEAKEIDLEDIIQDIMKDTSIISFFKNALHKKVEQEQ